MKKIVMTLTVVLGLILVGIPAQVAGQNEVTLDIFQFPERDTTKIPMAPSWRVSEVESEAEIRFVEGQTRIELKYKRLKPAVLFAGDVSCYVLWAISRDGTAENLGELWARPEKDEDSIVFSTGLKAFGLLVTAESFYTTQQPSSVIIMQSQQRQRRPLRATQVTLSEFAEAPKMGLDRLTNVRYDGKTPLDVVQAQKVMEIAGRLGADKYAPQLVREATIGLQQAIRASAGGARKGAQEYARRSVAASNDAIRICQRSIEAEELEARIAQRQAEMQAVEQRAANAEVRVQEFEAAVAKLEQQRADLERQQAANERALATSRAEIQTSRAELQSSRAELQKIADERSSLESAVQLLQQQQSDLKASMQDLQQQNVKLQNSLQGALSQIADTRQTAEGLILNLPDILFEINRATVKPELQVVLAKLAGVLLIMQDLKLTIEGHTDSTGSASRNLELSRERANAVLDFMARNGVASTRMTAVGYGMDRPIADNSTSEGRSKNRRVEILVRGAGSTS